MTAKVYVDKDYRRVAEGSPEAAFILNADDARLKAVKKAQEPAPTPQPERARSVK